MPALRHFLLVPLLASCAKPATLTAAKASSGAASHLVAVEKMSSLSAAVAALSSAGPVSCASPADCPASVGLLLAADAAGGLDPGSDSLLGCTAVLVGDDLALTNSHCIPSAVKLLPGLCASRVRLLLPAAEGHAPDSLACAALVGFSPRETAESPDLALLRLERETGRAPLAVDRGGVDPALPLRTYRITPNLKERTGVLSAGALCTPAPGSYRMPLFQSAANSVFVTGDCQAVPGNSGSPFLDPAGKLRGLLQASLPIPDDAAAQWLPHLAAPDIAFAPLAMGTSLGCLSEDPGKDVWTWNPACATIEDGDVANARPRLHDLLNTPLFLNTNVLAPYPAQAPLLGWAALPLQLTALDGTASLAPACAKEAFPNGLTVREPVYSVSVRFNRYLELVAPLETIEGEQSVAVPSLPNCE